MSFAQGLENALAEAEDASFQRPMASGGPPQWSGAPDPVAPNAPVNASVNSDLKIATSEAAAYFALSKTAPGAQVSVARGRYKVMAQPHIKGGKLFVTLSDLSSPTTDRYTLVVPSDANILPKLVKMGSAKGQTQVVDTATLKSEDVDEITIDGVPIYEYKGGTATMGSVGAGRAIMLHQLKAKKKKEDEAKKKKGKGEKGTKEDEEIDGVQFSENKMPADVLSMLRAKKEKGKKKKGMKKGEEEGEDNPGKY